MRKPSATLTIIEGDTPDLIDVTISFDPPTKEGEEDPPAYKVALVALASISMALEAKE